MGTENYRSGWLECHRILTNTGELVRFEIFDSDGFLHDNWVSTNILNGNRIRVEMVTEKGDPEPIKAEDENIPVPEHIHIRFEAFLIQRNTPKPHEVEVRVSPAIIKQEEALT